MPDTAPTCEVNLDGVWRALGLQEAQLQHRDAIKRCPACHGRVAILGTYGIERRLSLSHRRSHSGCPLSPRQYRGVPTRHPEAVE